MTRTHALVHFAGITFAAGLSGCPDPDTRLQQFASQVTHEQAAQNLRMAEGSHALTEGSQQLVIADAQARRELVALQQDLRHDQLEISRQRDELESERRAVARERRTDSALGSGLLLGGWLLACLSPLILAGFSLWGLWREPTREEEEYLLVEQWTQIQADAADTRPRLPPPSRRITTRVAPPGPRASSP